jgi:hypothetical protein
MVALKTPEQPRHCLKTLWRQQNLRHRQCLANPFLLRCHLLLAFLQLLSELSAFLWPAKEIPRMLPLSIYYETGADIFFTMAVTMLRGVKRIAWTSSLFLSPGTKTRLPAIIAR